MLITYILHFHMRTFWGEILNKMGRKGAQPIADKYVFKSEYCAPLVRTAQKCLHRPVSCTGWLFVTKWGKSVFLLPPTMCL